MNRVSGDFLWQLTEVHPLAATRAADETFISALAAKKAATIYIRAPVPGSILWQVIVAPRNAILNHLHQKTRSNNLAIPPPMPSPGNFPANALSSCTCGIIRSMDPKPRPNHRLYIETLRRMSPDARLRKAFELSAFTKAIFIEGIRRRFAGRGEDEIRRIIMNRLDKCHNRNY